jgi:hypothetical protein
MLNQPTIEKLHTMKMHGMADGFRAQPETTESHQLSFEERFALCRLLLPVSDFFSRDRSHCQSPWLLTVAEVH